MNIWRFPQRKHLVLSSPVNVLAKKCWQIVTLGLEMFVYEMLHFAWLFKSVYHTLLILHLILG